MGLQLQTILNAEDSPSRNGVPDTPTSARYPSGVSSVPQQVSLYQSTSSCLEDFLTIE